MFFSLDKFSCVTFYRSDTKKYFTYKRAIVGSLSRSVIDKSLKLSQPKEPIDYDKIIEQHNNYVNQLEMVLPGQVHRIPSDPQYPDQIFVEDPAVAAGGQVVLTKMAPETRKDEKGPMMNKLEELGVPYTELQDRSSSLDGGDVIFTGREFLIGLSSRTNQVKYYSMMGYLLVMLDIVYYIPCLLIPSIGWC